eukprot:6110045-Prymnesium_polylepis.1
MVIGYKSCRYIAGFTDHDAQCDDVDFAILLLAPLRAGGSLFATDAGWRTDVMPNAFQPDVRGERHMMHTATAEEQASTVLTMSNFSATINNQRIQLRDTHADQVIVYGGEQASPSYLCALDNSVGMAVSECPGSNGVWHQAHCSYSDTNSGRTWSVHYSDLPAGLSDGIDALSWPFKRFWAYRGPTTGSPGELRSAIGQQTNWISRTWGKTGNLNTVTRSAVLLELGPPFLTNFA